MYLHARPDRCVACPSTIGAMREFLRSPELSFSEVGQDVVYHAFKVSREGYDTPDPRVLSRLYVTGLQGSEKLGKMTESAQVALHREIADKLCSGAADHEGWEDHKLLASVSKVVFFGTMSAIFGGEAEGFATEETFRAFQDFDNGFPLLVGGVPLSLLSNAAAGLEKMLTLFSDPNVYATKCSWFIAERDK